MSGCCHFGAIFSCCVAQMQIICSWKKTQGICSNSFKIRENASDTWKDQLSIDMCLLRSTRCAYYQTGKGSLSNNKTSNNLQSSLPLILFSQRDVGELCRRNSDRIWDPRIPGGRWAVGGGCSGSHQWAVRPMAAMRTQLLLLTLLIGIANGQRRPPQVRLAVFINPLWSMQEDEDYGRGNRLSGRPPPPPGGRSGQPDLSRDVGQFPFPRGETPVFNFDQGDEVRNSSATTKNHQPRLRTAENSP